MKELFDRHADKLTPMERQVLWQTLSDAGAGESRSRIRGLLATAASASLPE